MDGRIIHNMSYADDIVILSTPVGALEVLIEICERYAVFHGLRFKYEKTQLLVFKARNKTP